MTATHARSKPPRPNAAACPLADFSSLDDSVAVAVRIPERDHRRDALAQAEHLGVGVDATCPKSLPGKPEYEEQ
jgi:hypothetical protein